MYDRFVIDFSRGIIDLLQPRKPQTSKNLSTNKTEVWEEGRERKGKGIEHCLYNNRLLFLLFFPLFFEILGEVEVVLGAHTKYTKLFAETLDQQWTLVNHLKKFYH